MTAFDPVLVADALVNLFAAGGAIVVAGETGRVDPRGPLTRRIVVALRFVALLFLVRAVTWLFGSDLSDGLTAFLAAATPLVSLIVAEGLLRRHGSAWLKALVCVGPGLVIACNLLPFVPRAVEIGILLVTVVTGFSGIVWLLWTRDKASLTASENRAIGRVLIGLAVLAPLVITDFRSILPEVPIRLGAMGALLLLYLGLGSGNVHALVGTRLASLTMFAVIAGIFGFGYLMTGDAPGFDQLVRVATVGFAGLVFAALFSESNGSRAERGRPVEPLLTSVTPADFRERLRGHAVLGDARILEGDDLVPVRDPAFDALLSAHPLLRRSQAPWGLSAQHDGVERVLSLMIAHDATHLMALTVAPMRLVVFSVPAIATDARTESEIDVARRIGAFVFAKDAAS